jgi:hypothetical protein
MFRDLSPEEQMRFLRQLWLDNSEIGIDRDAFLSVVKDAESFDVFLNQDLWLPNSWSRRIKFWSREKTLLVMCLVVFMCGVALSFPPTLGTGLLLGFTLLIFGISLVSSYIAAIRYASANELDVASWGGAMRRAIQKEWRGYE